MSGNSYDAGPPGAMSLMPSCSEGISGRTRCTSGSCDACHELYLRPYHPSKVTKQDLDFDFDSVFRKD